MFSILRTLYRPCPLLLRKPVFITILKKPATNIYWKPSQLPGMKHTCDTILSFIERPAKAFLSIQQCLRRRGSQLRFFTNGNTMTRVLQSGLAVPPSAFQSLAVATVVIVVFLSKRVWKKANGEGT